MGARSTTVLVAALVLMAARAACACETPVGEVVAADAGATVGAVGSALRRPAVAGRKLCAADLVIAPDGGHVVIRMCGGGTVHLPAGASLHLRPGEPNARLLPALLSIAFWRPRGAPRRLAATARFTTAAVESTASTIAPAAVNRSAGSRDRP